MGTCPPKFPDCLLTPKPEPEKRTTPCLQFLQVIASLCERLLSDNRHSAPRLPNHQDDRETQHLVLGSEA